MSCPPPRIRADSRFAQGSRLFRAPSTNAINLEALFQASPNPYVIFDTTLTIVGMNEAYLRETHSRREAIQDRHLFDAFPSDPASPGGRMLRESLDRVLREQVADHLALIPYVVPGPDGVERERYWSATHTPVFDNDGALTHILQHTTDVTEVHLLRQSAKAMQRESDMLARARQVQAENSLLSEERGFLLRLFEQAPGFMAVLRGPDHVFEMANSSYAKTVGYREVVGLPLIKALPEIADQGFVDLLDKVRATGEAYVGRGVPVMLAATPNGPLVQHYLDFIYQPLVGADGRPDGIFVQGHDITEQKLAEEELARQGDRLRLAQEAGGIGTFEWDLATGMLVGSKLFRELYGLPAEGPVPVTVFNDIIHPDDRMALATVNDQPLAEKIRRTEYRVIVGGQERWLARQGEVILDAEGKAVRVVGAVYDLTERKQAEAQLRLLMQEQAHRVKNTLAMVGAITNQTLRNAQSIDEARDVLNARLAALARAQDSLVQNHWNRAPVAAVVAGTVGLIEGGGTRFAVSGPEIMLEPKGVLGLALMLHELSTNAIKYGALSTAEGMIDITWSLEPGGLLNFVWTESGGPPVVAPARTGFGSKLIERGLSGYLGGSVTIDYAHDGLVCRALVNVAPVRV